MRKTSALSDQLSDGWLEESTRSSRGTSRFLLSPVASEVLRSRVSSTRVSVFSGTPTGPLRLRSGGGLLRKAWRHGGLTPPTWSWVNRWEAGARILKPIPSVQGVTDSSMSRSTLADRHSGCPRCCRDARTCSALIAVHCKVSLICRGYISCDKTWTGAILLGTVPSSPSPAR